MKIRPYNETFKFQPLAGRDVDLHPQNRRFAWSSEHRSNGQALEESAGVWPMTHSDPSADELNRVEGQGTERSVDEPRPQLRRSADGRVEKPEPLEQEPPEADEDYDDEPAPKVLMVDSLGELSANVAGAVLDMVPEPELLLLEDPAGILDAVDDHDPEVLMVAPADMTEATMTNLAEVRRAHPKVVTVVSDSDAAWTPAQIVASGARDILPADPAPEVITASLGTALEIAEDLRSQKLLVTERIVVQKVETPAPRVELPIVPDGRVFTVTSATGGSGKTFLASNLAAYLVRATGKRVLLVDLDLQFGALTSSLHLHPKRTVEHLVREEGNLEGVLSDHLIEHRSGFKVLCAPADPLAGEWTAPQDVSRILDAAQKQFDYIVVDGPPTLSETCLAAFDKSEALLIVANMDVPSLKNLRRFIETLDALKVSRSLQQLVINRADAGMGIELAQVEPLFPQGFLTVLPSSDLVRSSINMGVPLMYERPDSAISRLLAEGFMKLVPVGTGQDAPAAAKKGRFKSLRKATS